MKSKSIFTISLCTALAAVGVAAFSGSSLASAASSSVTEYPDIFTQYVNNNLDGLIDFATDGRNGYAFADKNGIIMVKDEERTTYSVDKSYGNISALDYYNGTYYYKQGSNSYSLPSLEAVNYEFEPAAMRVSVSDGDYEIIEEKCCYHATGTYSFDPIDDENLCHFLKVYQNVAYAIIEQEDGSKIVKKLSGTESETVNPTYIDFTGVEKVALGTIKSSLGSYNLETPHFAKLKYGSYYTEINIDSLSGDYFDADKDKTYKCGAEGAISDSEVMLVLGETGNAKVFTRSGKCYIALSNNLQPDTDTENSSVEEAEFTDAYINAPDFIYTSPYLSTQTKAVKLSAGDAVKVTGKISNEVVGLQFYKVEFDENKQTFTGYVLSDFLRPYTAGETEHPDDKSFGVIEDPDYSDDDYVKMVVLLLIVIALVLIGLAYITYILTTKKNKASTKAENEKGEDGNKKE